MRKKYIPTEYAEQATFCQWLTLKRIPHFATQNENPQSYTDKKAAMIIESKAKAVGKKKGVPDMVCFLPDKIVFIEMKRRANSKVSDEQEKWNELINKYPYAKAHICYGFDEAKAVIEQHLRG